MSAWITLAATDLNDYLVAAQVTALRTAAMASGQTDPFLRIMPDRTAYVRNRISKRIQISATANSVPPELRTAACMLIIEAMQIRLNLTLTEDQKTQISRAYKDLDIAGTADFPVSTPDDPITPTVQAGPSISVVNKSKRTDTGASLAGF